MFLEIFELTASNMRVFILTLFLVIGCGAQEKTEDGKSALTRYADQLEKSGLVEKLDRLDQRLATIEQGLADLQKHGVTPTPPVRVVTPSRDHATASTNPLPPVRVVTPSDPPDTASSDLTPTVRVVTPAPFTLTIPAPTQITRITLWHAYRGQEREAFEKTCSDFTAKFPTIVVAPQEVPFMALRDKIVVTVPRGTGPDLFVYVHNPMGDWLLKGDILVPLSSYIEKFDSFDNLAKFIPDTVKALAYDGTLYGLPLAFKARAMFYNKKLVKDVPTTVDSLVIAARTASRGEGEERVYGLLYEAGLLYHHAPFAHGLGATIMDDGGKAHINSEQFVKSAEMVRDWVQNEEVLPDLNKDMAKFLFNNNQAGIVFKGPWFLGEIDEGIEYGVAPMPDVAEGQPAKPYLGADGIYLANCSQNKELAFQVMRYLVSDQAAAVRYVEGGQLVANAGLYDDKQLSSKANPALEVFRKQADNAVIISARPEMQAVWSTADNALRKIIFGDGVAQEVLNEAQAKIEKDIASMGNK
jgi:arabinogalactan oligomer / maltooligosaccharide transport system substrate-binding protein